MMEPAKYIPHLVEDEIEHELYIRNQLVPGSLDDRRGRLLVLLHAEHTGLPSYVVRDRCLPAEDESDKCMAKLLELWGKLLSLSVPSSERLQLSELIRSRLFYLQKRITFLGSSAPAEAHKLQKVAERIQDIYHKSLDDTPVASLLDLAVDDSGLSADSISVAYQPAPAPLPTIPRESSFEHRIRQLRFADLSPDHCQAATQMPFASGSFVPIRPLSTDGTRVLPPYPVSSTFEQLPQLVPLPYRDRPYLSVLKWNITFDGRSGVNQFLERLQEAAAIHGASDDILLQQAAALFSGDALVWYRMIKPSVTSWPELVSRLRSSFLPTNYDLMLMDEIRQRTQSTSERVEIFIAIMQNLFSRLSKPPVEAERIALIRRNLLPQFQRACALQSIPTLSELIRVCRLVEDTEHDVAHYHAPPSVNSFTLEPDLAVQTPVRPRVAEVSACLPRTTFVCWNCGQPGHGFSQCQARRRLFCHKCGLHDVDTRDCPKCSARVPKKRGRRRRLVSSRASTRPYADNKAWASWLNVVHRFIHSPSVAPVIVSAGNDNRPFISVHVGKHSVTALVDTGASVSIIGYRGLSALKHCRSVLSSSHVQSIATADGTAQNVSGSITIPITVDRVTKSVTFMIVPSIRHSMILGIDFVRAFNLSFTFSADHWSMHPELASCADPNTSKSLTNDQLSALQSVIADFKTLSRPELGVTPLVEHEIVTDGAKPIKQRQYPLSEVVRQHMNRELDEMIRLGVVQPSSSAWSSPILMVRKTSGEYRFCFDGRRLNEVTKKDAYPLPRVDDILNHLKNVKYLTSIDLKSAFWQIPLEASSREKTAFSVPGRGLFEFVRMPFGLCNAPQTLQRLMDRIIGPEFEPKAFVYLDDCIIATNNFEDHLLTLKEIFTRLRKAGFTINIDKCQFCRPSLKYLGFVVDQNGLRTDPDKVSAISQFPLPSTVTEIKRFLGMCSWYRRFVPGFATLSAPISDLIKGKKKKMPVTWTPEATKSFSDLKAALTSSPVLVSPDYTFPIRPFKIHTDASNYGLGAVLTQEDADGCERAIAFASRTLNRAERNYSVTERECLAVVFATDKFRPYVEGLSFTVVTDHHSLVWLTRMSEPTGRLARWAVKLQQYDFTLAHRPGVQNELPDALSRAPIEIAAFENFADTDDRWYRELRDRISRDPASFPEWRVENNLIRHLARRTAELPDNLTPWKIVVPRPERSAIIADNHCPPTAAHLGVLKTVRRIANYFYWPHLYSSVSRYVRRCRVCLAQKVEQRPPAGLMGREKQITAPWQAISIDIQGPFPASSYPHRYQYILAVSDWFSKFLLLFPLKQAAAPQICDLLEKHVFLLFGVPQIVMTDNGTQFTSNVFRNLIEKYEVPKLWYNAKFHPQVNFVERSHRVVKTAIRSYVANNHRDWDKNLQQIAQAIRTSVHQVTGLAPSFLTFGRHVPTSGRFYADPPKNICSSEPLAYANKLQPLSTLFSTVQERIHLAYDRNARYYNRRRRHVEYNVGDVVWKRNFVLSDGARHYSAKLAPRFIECRITERSSPVVYRVSDLAGNDLGSWHVSHLKPDYQEEDTHPETEARSVASSESVSGSESD